MKFIYCIAIVLGFTSCASNLSSVKIPAEEYVTIDSSSLEYYEVKIKNKSNESVDIAIIDKESSQKTGGFGLGQRATESVSISSSQRIQIQNPSSKVVKVATTFEKKEKPKVASEIVYVDFSLVNKSAKSIPLIIPGVMNPNLSPFGTSGVGLKVGQEVLFKEKGKKYIFFIVDQSYEGKKIDVAEKLKQRRKELGLI